ncbi:MAG TPA: hypothetical protein VKZ63_06615 [Kofleriaceae bacterium]|nr:hypothetical protein [Kofleriaceae bacterium]
MKSTIRASLFAFAILPLAAACGGDDDGGDGDGISFVDSGTGADSGTGEQPDGAVEVTCPVDENPAAVDALMEALAGQETQDPADQAEGAPENPQTYYIFGGIGNMDLVELDLWEGYGVFAEGDKRVVPGTYTIEGAEAAVLSCGVCFFLLGDFNPNEGTIEMDYIATAGTVTIDSVEGNLTGTAENVTFSQIDPNSEDGSALPGGCTATFPSISFTAPIEPEQ